jgi:hypothetical protein
VNVPPMSTPTRYRSPCLSQRASADERGPELSA